MKKEKIIKYLKGTAKVLEELSKEINKFGIDKKSVDLIKEVGSDLLFKGVTIGLFDIKDEKQKLKTIERGNKKKC